MTRTKMFRLTAAIVVTIAALTGGGFLFAEGGPEQNADYVTIPGRHAAEWNLVASDGLLIGGYGDNFNYDGSRVKPVGGNATISVNARDNTGLIEVEFNGTINPEKDTTYTGDIRIVYDTFSEGSDLWEGGVADFVMLHGDTGQKAPVMPALRTYLATWGPADVYVDGKLVYENLAGHTMYTERSRDPETCAIYAADGKSFYSPADPANASIFDPDEREIHFVAHTTDPDSGNFPPHTVWIHLNFATVEEVK